MGDFPGRGDVYWVDLNPTVGSEINKRRPCLVVSNDAGNVMSQRIIIAPITSSSQRLYPFEVEADGRQGKVLLDQVRSVDKKRLTSRIASFSQETMRLVDKALKIALSLN